MLYRRGNIWWYKKLEEAIHGIKKRVAPVTFAVAAAEWLELKKPTLAAKSHRIEQVNIDNHLKLVFGPLLLIDIAAEDVADYQKVRLKDGASPKTINLEVGTLRSILRRHRLWADLQPDTRMLTVRRCGRRVDR